MLNEIRRVFRASMDALYKELNSQEPQDQVAELLMAMRRELVAAKAALPEYERAIDQGKAELVREKNSVEECERRGRLASSIGDEETAKIADSFADRHRQKALVLEQKLTAMQAELDMRRGEVDEMREKYKLAEANRFVLLAQLRASGEQRATTFSSEDGAFADFARIEDQVEHQAAYVDALEELDDPEVGPAAPDPARVEERLRELKRRMGQE